MPSRVLLHSPFCGADGLRALATYKAGQGYRVSLEVPTPAGADVWEGEASEGLVEAGAALASKLGAIGLIDRLPVVRAALTQWQRAEYEALVEEARQRGTATPGSIGG